MTDLTHATAIAITLLVGCVTTARFSKLDTQLREESRQGEFSGVVLVAKGDATELAQPYGEGISLDTCFSLASASKMFTIVAVQQLIENGKLRRDDRVGAYVTTFPAAADVTIDQLLTHTSGLPAGVTPEFFAAIEGKQALDDMLAAVASPLDFSPGTKKQYSNIGYLLLGRIVEKASGETFDEYINKHVTGSAGMTHTTAGASGCATPMTRGMPGASPSDGTRRAFPAPHATPAGGWSSSASDLQHFAHALRARKLVSAAPESLGFGARAWAGHRMVGHNGGAPGMNAEFWLLDADETIVVLSNFDPPTATRLADQIAAMITGSNPPPVGGKLLLRKR